MAYELCTNVFDAFKLDNMEHIDLSLLEKIIALDCRSCEALRKRIQAATIERLENPDSDDEGEELNYDKGLLTLEVSKTTYGGIVKLSHFLNCIWEGISVWMLIQCLSW